MWAWILRWVMYDLLSNTTDWITLRLKLEDDFFLNDSKFKSWKIIINSKPPKEDLADIHKTPDNQKNKLLTFIYYNTETCPSLLLFFLFFHCLLLPPTFVSFWKSFLFPFFFFLKHTFLNFQRHTLQDFEKKPKFVMSQDFWVRFQLHETRNFLFTTESLHIVLASIRPSDSC